MAGTVPPTDNLARFAAILRAGSDSFRSSTEIAAAMREGLEAAGLPADAIQLVPTRDRAAVGEILAGLGGNIDVVVPRGGKSLVARVQSEARVPVFAHLDGNCHVYVDRAADPAMARDILLNAKLRRTGVCGAAETLLVDDGAAETHLASLVTALLEAGCAVRGDEAAQAVDSRVTAATEQDWATEYLDRIIAVKTVPGLGAAIDHIERYGSHHTDAIVTANEEAAARFLAEVDSAIVIHNAWYAEPEMVELHGKLGRSQGCFAFSRADQWSVMQRLGDGRMIYADKLA